MKKHSRGKVLPAISAQENGRAGKGVFDNIPPDRCVYILTGLLLTLIFFVFRNFLLLKAVYLYKDIGSDSLNVVYPNLVQLSRYIRMEGFPRWSFYQGMGQNIFPSLGYNFMGLFLLLPPGGVAYGIIYVEVLKTLLAGIIFYLYLKKLRLSAFSSVVGGALFAFSGYIVLGSCWSVFSSEAVFAAFLLYAFEKYFKEGAWFFFPLAVALMGIHQVFLWLPYAIFIFIYAMARFFQEGERSAGELPVFYLKLTGLGLLGAAISAVFSFGNVLLILQSPRVGGGASYFHQLASHSIFDTASLIETVSAIGRSFSTDMLGTGNNFKGYNNYLEAPIFYCGLLSLLLAPQIFYFSDKRRKIINGMILLLCALPVVFPFFRLAFWGFSGDYYRSLSLVIVLVILWFATQSLSYIDKTGRVSPVLLAGTLSVLLAALFFPYFDDTNSKIDPNLRNIAAVFLAGYVVLVYLMGGKKYKFPAQVLLLSTVCVELAYFSSITVNKHPLVSAEELRGKTGYNDYSADAVAWLNSIDPGFFRVAKTYGSSLAEYASANDSQVQGYKSTSAYASFNQLYYVKFLGEMGVLDATKEDETRWLWGLDKPFRALSLSFASVKYALAHPGSDLGGKGYKPIKILGDVQVFENSYFLPLGFTYDKYVPYESFKTLSAKVKEQSLLRAFVAGSDDLKDFSGLKVFDPVAQAEPLSFEGYGRYVNALKEETLSFTESGQNRLAGTIDLAKEKLLFFSIPYDKGWKAKVDGRPAELKLVNIGFMGLPLEHGRHRVELEFTPPLLYAGELVSAAGLVIYGFLVWYTRKKRSCAA